jgi:thiol:disulfide interchange protein DsbD
MNNQELIPYIDFLKGFANPYLGVLVAGFFYGMTLCSFSCLPYIGTYIMGTQDGFKKGFKATIIFSISRIATYTLLGGLCGYIGSVILKEINPESILLITGSVIALIGIIVILMPLRACPQSSHKISERISLQNPYLHLIFMGVVISLIPCLPLTSVLLYSSTTQSIFTGGLIALIFSIGTSISPLCLFGGLAGWLSKKIRFQIPQRKGLMQRISGIVLVLLGIKLLYMAFYV